MFHGKTFPNYGFHEGLGVRGTVTGDYIYNPCSFNNEGIEQ